MSKTEFQADIAIVGGGLAGMALAIAAAQRGVDVVVLERGTKPALTKRALDVRTSAIAKASSDFLDSIGVWPHVAPHACPILDIRITDGSVSTGESTRYVHFDHADVGTAPMGHIVENIALRDGLLKRLNELKEITYLEEAAVTAVDADVNCVQLKVADGRGVTAQLAVAADGKFSRVRELCHIDVQQHAYGQSSIVCAVSHEKPHEHVACEKFFASGPFASLPMNDGAKGRHQSSIVWTEQSKRAQLLYDLDDKAFTFELSRRFGGHWGELKLVGERLIYPLMWQMADSMTAQRVALIGDAGHAMHPIAGQGINLGFRDVEALDALIGKALHVGGDVGHASLLEDYAKQRHLDVHSMMQVTHHLNGLFSTANPTLRAGRRAVMGLVQQLPFIKKPMMKHAMGQLL